MGKTPFLPPPLDAEQGRGGGAPAAARFGRPGRRRWLRGGEKGLGGAWGSIPQLTSARGAAREQGDVNRRRRAEMAAAAAL